MSEKSKIDVKEQGIPARSTLFPDEFKDLYSFLNTIKAEFPDFGVSEGQFRSHSNYLTVIVEAYFEFFKNMTFAVENTKDFARMLSTLNKRSDIIVSVRDGSIIFSDGYQTVRFPCIDESVSNNNFMSLEEMKPVLEPVEDEPILRETLPKSVIINIGRAVKGCNASGVKYSGDEVDPYKGSIVVANSDDSSGYSVVLREKLLKPMDGHYFIVPAFPYSFNKDDMVIEARFFEGRTILRVVHQTRIGSLQVTLFSRAICIPESEE